MAAPNVNGRLHVTGVHQKPPASFRKLQKKILVVVILVSKHFLSKQEFTHNFSKIFGGTLDGLVLIKKKTLFLRIPLGKKQKCFSVLQTIFKQYKLIEIVYNS